MTYFRTQKLKVEDPRLIQIPIQELCSTGSWSKEIIKGRRSIALKYFDDGILRLTLFDKNLLPREIDTWKVFQREGNQLLNGGYTPDYIFYVIGKNGKRYRNLYLFIHDDGAFNIGTRGDFKLRYTYNC